MGYRTETLHDSREVTTLSWSTGRPRGHAIHQGLHECFGESLRNSAAIAILMPELRVGKYHDLSSNFLTVVEAICQHFPAKSKKLQYHSEWEVCKGDLLFYFNSMHFEEQLLACYNNLVM